MRGWEDELDFGDRYAGWIWIAMLCALHSMCVYIGILVLGLVLWFFGWIDRELRSSTLAFR